MNKTKIKRLFLFLSILNVLIAYKLSIAADVSGSITINPCTENCLVLTTPASLSLNSPIFLSPNGGKIFTNFNYALNQKLEITDRRYNGGFRVDVAISNLAKTDEPSRSLSSSQIGILSFNRSSTSSVDANPSDTTVISPVDPVEKGLIMEPFTQDEFAALVANPPINYDEYFTFFSEPNRSDESLTPTVLDAPTESGRIGTYSLGLGFLIKTPANPHNNLGARSLRDGQYQTTLTFTLLPT